MSSISVRDKVIGILGGMGPEATAYLYREIIKATPVQRDQDHFQVIVDSNPKIPDRTAAILGEGPSPVPELVKTARNLERAGATLIAMPCITAHYFIEDVQDALNVSVVNMLQEVHGRIASAYSDIKRIGVLATSGTIKTRMMDKYLSLPYDIVYPEEASQMRVMEAIYGKDGIKQGNTGRYPVGLLIAVGEELISNGARLIIAGCTELPLVLKEEHFTVPLLNPLEILAQALVA